jgi:hypothetical protein
MTWNHAYSIGFAVGGLKDEDPVEALRKNKPEVIAALLERVEQLLTNDAEYIEALGNGAFDSYEETK